MLSSRKAQVGFLLSAVFLLLFLRQLDGLHVGEVLASADYRWLVAAVPVYFLAVWFRTLRWQALLSSMQSIPQAPLFRQVVMGYMANNLLPARTGELVRAYLAGRSFDLPRAPILSTIAIERISDGLTLLAFMALAALFSPLPEWISGVLLVMGAVFSGASVALALVIKWQRGGARVWLFVGRRLPAPIRGPLARVGAGLIDGVSVVRKPRVLGVAACHAILCWGWEAMVFYLTGLALGIEVPLVAYVLAMCTANLATALPSSQAGIGPFGFFCAETMILYGLSPAEAGAFALLVHAVLIILVVVTGLACLARDNLTFGGLVSDATGRVRSVEVS